MFRKLLIFSLLASGFAWAAPITAQEAESDQSEAAQSEGLRLLFPTGSSRIPAGEAEKLDQASRLFRDGNPVVMIVVGHADTVGDPSNNLDLSIDRARAVASELSARGIPVDRLQVLGQGNSELPVSTQDETPNVENRSVSITWR